MSEAAKQHVVLCEGYDDRSFWKGWLQNLGCTDPTEDGRRPIADAWGLPVTGKGRYMFRTPAGSDVIVQPFHGRNNARQAVGEYLEGKQAHRPRRVVLNLDSDSKGGGEDAAERQVRGIATELGAAVEGPGPYEIGASLLCPVIWRCPDAEPRPGVPPKQTLERLAASATCAAYPDRGPVVAMWLEAQPRGLDLPRSYGYSYYAKWYPDHGVSDFYAALWRDQAIAGALKQLLEATGAWRTVVELVED